MKNRLFININNRPSYRGWERGAAALEGGGGGEGTASFAGRRNYKFNINLFGWRLRHQLTWDPNQIRKGWGLSPTSPHDP